MKNKGEYSFTNINDNILNHKVSGRGNVRSGKCPSGIPPYTNNTLFLGFLLYFCLLVLHQKLYFHGFYTLHHLQQRLYFHGFYTLAHLHVFDFHITNYVLIMNVICFTR